MSTRTIKPADEHDPETRKGLAAKLVADRRKAIAKEVASARWEGEWWKREKWS